MEPIPKASNKSNHFLSMIGLSSFPSTPPNDFLDIKVAEIKGPRAMDMCNINILTPGKFFRNISPTYNVVQAIIY